MRVLTEITLGLLVLAAGCGRGEAADGDGRLSAADATPSFAPAAHQGAVSRVELATDYLFDGIAGTRDDVWHQAVITFDPRAPGDAELQLDPNTCDCSRFGQPICCTEIAPTYLRVKLRLLEEERGQRLYAIYTGDRELSAPHLRLAILAAPGAEGGDVIRLLVVEPGAPGGPCTRNATDHVTRVLGLHATRR